MEAFLDSDAFIALIYKELSLPTTQEVSLDSRFVDDLGCDSLQMMLAIDVLAELSEVDSTMEEDGLLTALDTVRTAHNYYLTCRSMPISQSESDVTVGYRVGGVRGSSIALVPPQANHYSKLYEIAVSNDIAWRWRYGGAIPSYDEFLRTFANGVLTQLVVTKDNDQNVIGLVVGYNANLVNRTAYLAAVIDPLFVGTGLGVRAVVAFLRHLFMTWDFEKIYMEVPEFNASQFASGIDREFDCEARLKGHVYHGGRRWDQLTYAVYRDRFSSRWCVDMAPKPDYVSESVSRRPIRANASFDSGDQEF